MASYEILAQYQPSTMIEESNFITYNKKSIVPTQKIKKILKSIRKFFKKERVSPVQYNGDLSVLEMLPNDHQQPTVEISFYSEEECDNQENERLEAEMSRQ